MSEKNIEIKNFDYAYWDDFVDLINTHWKKDHPIINQELFEWQHSGFGNNKGSHHSKILLVDGKLEGFRGVIPVDFQIGNNVCNGCAFAIWIITPDYRGKGLGYKMLKKN
jgi:GNAT superfamily N-acetyltransferase